MLSRLTLYVHAGPPMSLHSVPPLSFAFFPSRPVQIEISPAPLTSDAGLLPIRQFV
jgi:hypothetical protein